MIGGEVGLDPIVLDPAIDGKSAHANIASSSKTSILLLTQLVMPATLLLDLSLPYNPNLKHAKLPRSVTHMALGRWQDQNAYILFWPKTTYPPFRGGDLKPERLSAAESTAFSLF